MEISKREAGSAAEKKAENFLGELGYAIIDRNFRSRQGEIDLIARDGETVVFIEVRSRTSSSWGLPEETVGPAKRRRIIQTARFYAYRKRIDAPMRFDVVAIEDGRIRHIPDAFQAF